MIVLILLIFPLVFSSYEQYRIYPLDTVSQVETIRPYHLCYYFIISGERVNINATDKEVELVYSRCIEYQSSSHKMIIVIEIMNPSNTEWVRVDVIGICKYISWDREALVYVIIASIATFIVTSVVCCVGFICLGFGLFYVTKKWLNKKNKNEMYTSINNEW